MSDQQVHDTPTPSGTATPDRRRTPRSVVPPPARRTSALFPPTSAHGPSPSRLRRLALEAVSERRNLVPLSIIVILGLVGIGLIVTAATRRPWQPPDPALAHIAISSSESGTSLFANARYLGEIGPGPREFAIPPGRLHLRLIRTHCRASDTTLDLRAGEQRLVGPLDPLCGRP
jgi:hypothetical protein